MLAESDYTILAWRQKSREDATESQTPTELPAILHLHNPAAPLPQPPAYCNPSFYAFKKPKALSPSRAGSIRGAQSLKSNKSKRSVKSGLEDDGIPKFKKDFYNFHNENGVRTVIGSVGPIRNGELWELLALRMARLTVSSSNVTEKRLPTCIHLTGFRSEARVYTQKRAARNVWLWWSCEVRHTYFWA